MRVGFSMCTVFSAAAPRAPNAMKRADVSSTNWNWTLQASVISLVSRCCGRQRSVSPREFNSCRQSEVKLQRELDLSGRPSCEWEAEIALVCRNKRIELQRRGLGADRPELSEQIIHVVENVEEFGAEFQSFVFGDGKLFDQRGIPFGVSRALDDVAPGIAEGSENGVV